MNGTARKTGIFQVLVVDDELLIRHFVPKVLKPLGIVAEVAENGLQAQQKIRTGRFDLVITDIGMPEMDGLELLLWMRNHRPGLEGIIISGHDASETMSGGNLTNVADYLTKPFKMMDLQEAVRRSMVRHANRDAEHPVQN